MTVQSQLFKSYGINFSYSIQSSGWEHPDTLSKSYHDRPHISAFNAGLYGEFLAKKYYSTIVGLAMGVRAYLFEYDINNPNGPQTIHNDITLITLSASEKLRYDMKTWSFYIFGGIKFDFQYHRALDNDFESEFSNSTSIIPSLTTGIGFAKGFSKFWRISFDLYFNHDISKMINTQLGNARNNEFGFKLGLGLYNPINK